MHVHTLTMYLSATPGNGIEEKGFEQKNSFQENLKELTEVAWQTETGGWFQTAEDWYW